MRIGKKPHYSPTIACWCSHRDQADYSLTLHTNYNLDFDEWKKLSVFDINFNLEQAQKELTHL